VLLLVGSVGLSWYRSGPAAPVRSEPLLLGEFVNTTGEAVFDGALRDALQIQLQQSPHVSVIPDAQVRAALQLMERAPTEPVTAALAQDLCQRMGVKAVLLGSIAPLGSQYVITLDAQACRSGESIAREQTQARSRTDVLASVGAAAARLRERLGESIGSIQRFNVPAPDATTRSLDALKAYSMGLETRIKIGDVQAIPFFEHALELDPGFALAAARLGAIYTNLGEIAQARTYVERAFARSDSLSAPERLFIKSHYHYTVTGRLDEAVGALRLWAETYPLDWVPHNNLSDTYERLGQLDAAVEHARTAVRLGPEAVVPYQQLARVLIGLDRFDEAKAVVRDAAARGLESSTLHVRALDLAFVAGDRAAVEDRVRSAALRPDGYVVLTEAARAAAAGGEFHRAQKLYEQAALSARTAQMAEFAGTLAAEQALEAAIAGDGGRAGAFLSGVLRRHAGPDTTWMAALASAICGRAEQAAELAASYERMTARAPDVVTVMQPILAGAIALANSDPKSALETLDRATRFEHVAGPWLPYLRGAALQALGDPVAAAAQFVKVNASRGRLPVSIVRPVARLQLARALRDAGNADGARQAYADFFVAWKAADSDLPLVTAARAEAAALR
jgi:tetratricopeptide (TPR) repeat protein